MLEMIACAPMCVAFDIRLPDELRKRAARLETDREIRRMRKTRLKAVLGKLARRRRGKDVDPPVDWKPPSLFTVRFNPTQHTQHSHPVDFSVRMPEDYPESPPEMRCLVPEHLRLAEVPTYLRTFVDFQTGGVAGRRYAGGGWADGRRAGESASGSRRRGGRPASGGGAGVAPRAVDERSLGSSLPPRTPGSGSRGRRRQQIDESPEAEPGVDRSTDEARAVASAGARRGGTPSSAMRNLRLRGAPLAPGEAPSPPHQSHEFAAETDASDCDSGSEPRFGSGSGPSTSPSPASASAAAAADPSRWMPGNTDGGGSGPRTLPHAPPGFNFMPPNCGTGAAGDTSTASGASRSLSVPPTPTQIDRTDPDQIDRTDPDQVAPSSASRSEPDGGFHPYCVLDPAS